jgi:hypothetical protein
LFWSCPKTLFYARDSRALFLQIFDNILKKAAQSAQSGVKLQAFKGSVRRQFP